MSDTNTNIVNESIRLAGDPLVLNIAGIEFPFRWCPPGTFMMGSPESEEGRYYDERLHQVTFTHGFWMLETPVTQVMWEGVTGKNPSYFKKNRLPVEHVSWFDCQTYIYKLNDLSVIPNGYRFSLPTEAQWEYACRAGTTIPYHFENALDGNKANFGSYPYGTKIKGPCFGKTTEVGLFPANAWGLYDMHGNVWEWCLDWYGDYPCDDMYENVWEESLDWYGYLGLGGCVTDPVGPSSGLNRVLRGGSWYSDPKSYCRSASRNFSEPSSRNRYIGVRLSLIHNEPIPF